jgi:two-component system chemotaxis response regulator CheY
VRISYPERSSFEAMIRTAIKEGHHRLSRGLPVTLSMGPRGFKGSFAVTIDPDDIHCFETDWEHPDPSRFPARIRAAAKALLAEGQFGTFAVSHADGILQIRRSEILPSPTGVLLVRQPSGVGADLRAILESDSGFRVVGELTDARVALSEYRRLCPDVVCMDLGAGRDAVLTATKAIVSEDPNAAIAHVSAAPCREEARLAAMAGCLEYVCLPCRASTLMNSVWSAASWRTTGPLAPPAKFRPSMDRYWPDHGPEPMPPPGQPSIAAAFGEPQDDTTPRLQLPSPTQITLSNGRSILIDRLVVRGNYAGIFVGNPYGESRAIWVFLPLLLDRMMACRVHPLYVVDEACPVLPSYRCVAQISSAPKDPHLAASTLFICWFTDDLAGRPLADTLKSILDGIEWDKIAVDQDW